MKKSKIDAVRERISGKVSHNYLHGNRYPERRRQQQQQQQQQNNASTRKGSAQKAR